LLGTPAALAQAPARDGQEPPASTDLPVQGSGFAFSVRAGFGLPLGLASGGDGETEVRLKDIANGLIPVQLDAGLFLGSSFYIGASFQYGRVLLATDCPEPPVGSVGSGCSATDLRFGVNASFHLPTSGRWSPWLGGGVGYESFKPGRFAYKGFDFNVQGGADYHFSGPVWVGPFAMFTRGEYSNVNDKEPHTWLMGGLRLLMRH
jgi:hypothetical protein